MGNVKRATSILLAVAAVAVFSLAGASTRRIPPPRTPDITEHDYDLITERANLYLQRHGDAGVIDPSHRLRLVNSEYQSRQALVRNGQSPEAVAGNTWVSLGPTNGAGRATAIAADPTRPGTIYLGAADGG